MDDFDFIEDDILDDEIDDDIDFVLDDEFLDKHFHIVPDSVIENFPFIEDDVDAITDYQLFSKGFGYLDEKKADKTEIPDVSNFITKNVDDLTYYTKTSDLSEVALTGDYTDLSNKPTIPTKTSDLNNDSGFITKDVNDLTNYPLTSTLSSVAFSGDYDDLLDKPTIPDVSNFITKDVNDLTYYTLSSNLSTVATTGDYDDLLDKPTLFSGDYNDLTNKPTIPTVPTNVSAFNNDSGYITKSVNDLTNYTDTTTLTSLLNNKENIILSGSNANGSYIKFDNGDMICYTEQDLGKLNYSTAFGSVYWTNQVHGWTFPAEFISPPSFVIPSVYTTSISGANLQSIPTTTNATCFIYCMNSSTSRSTILQWIAIGKWK